ncbi:hypothetical protein [uncultured Piscinibacter sp.]|uniref:hypothetical protein n=1 Tax=uncultured Piscinibacter sp. TaxID=1131835 RepID=UPI00261ABCF6|nr:hypothetical protein [uncultured Piscinibacter sp.]
MVRRSIIVLLGALAAGCVNMSNPAQLAPGASAEAIRAHLGEPTGRHALADGAQRLEYARGPYGSETWMLDVDAQGRLRSATQVLNEASFATITAGMTRDEVLRAIGRPSNIGHTGWTKQTVWSYRYRSPFCQWFQVGLSRAGIVEDTGYGPDPLCDDVDKPLIGILRHR